MASIFKGSDLALGGFFDRFFGSKKHSKSDLKKSVRQAKSIGKTNTKSTSALLQQSIFQAKLDEKSFVFLDIDFRGILDGFWEGFERSKSITFRIFSRKNGSEK